MPSYDNVKLPFSTIGPSAITLTETGCSLDSCSLEFISSGLLNLIWLSWSLPTESFFDSSFHFHDNASVGHKFTTSIIFSVVEPFISTHGLLLGSKTSRSSL